MYVVSDISVHGYVLRGSGRHVQNRCTLYELFFFGFSFMELTCLAARTLKPAGLTFLYELIRLSLHRGFFKLDRPTFASTFAVNLLDNEVISFLNVRVRDVEPFTSDAGAR